MLFPGPPLAVRPAAFVLASGTRSSCSELRFALMGVTDEARHAWSNGSARPLLRSWQTRQLRRYRQRRPWRQRRKRLRAMRAHGSPKNTPSGSGAATYAKTRTPAIITTSPSSVSLINHRRESTPVTVPEGRQIANPTYAGREHGASTRAPRAAERIVRALRQQQLERGSFPIVAETSDRPRSGTVCRRSPSWLTDP